MLVIIETGLPLKSLWSRDATEDTSMASWTLYIHLFSCAGIFTSARSLSNGVEMNAWLVAIASLQRFFRLFHRASSNYSHSRLILSLIAFSIVFSVMARPTSVLLWLPLGVWLWSLPLAPPVPIPGAALVYWSRSERLWVRAYVY